jgi:hypothetical protein
MPNENSGTPDYRMILALSIDSHPQNGIEGSISVEIGNRRGGRSYSVEILQVFEAFEKRHP